MNNKFENNLRNWKENGVGAWMAARGGARLQLHLISNGEGCPGKSRHMRVRWHFISEMIENNYLRYEHIDTNLMVADILTKPMGGSKFRELRGIMMNCLVTDDDAVELEELDDTLP